MSRNLSGVYTLPVVYEATPGDTILATQHNTPLEDIQTDLNTPRPVVAGGTGVDTEIEAWDVFAKKGNDVATTGTLNLQTATGPLIDLTGTTTVTAVTLSERSLRICRAAAAFQLTASASLIVNGSASTNYTTTEGDLLIFQGYGSSVVRVWAIPGGNSTPTFATSTQAKAGSSATVTANPANLGTVRQLLDGTRFNLGLLPSVNANALTIALKGADGNDPSSDNPVEIPFRNVSGTVGTPTVLQVTAATSIVVSSGSTLGTSNGVSTTLIVVAFNDGGTFRMGVINPLSLPVKEGIASSTAEGGAGAADSAGVFYTGTAVTSKAMAVLGWVTISEATAGTWATAHTAVGVGNAPMTAMQSQAGQLMAWVNFNGTGTVAIRGSGNVSSITDGGTGVYTVNFTTAMPDANYSLTGSIAGIGLPSPTFIIGTLAAGSAQFSLSGVSGGSAVAGDSATVCVTVVR